MIEGKYDYIYDAKWYEKDTPKCSNCGSPMQTVFYGKQGETEVWECPICEERKPKVD